MTSAPPPAPPFPDPPTDQQPPPPSGPPARPQLRRSPSDKMIGGVAGGLAEYSGIDPLLWRVGFVALTVAGGSGVLVYLLLWLLMPVGTGAPGPYTTPFDRWTDRRAAGPRSPVPRVTIAGLLIVVGALVLITHLTDWQLGPRGFLGTALLVVGLGLIATAFTSGRRAKGGLIALGVVLSLALIAASSEPWHGNADMGDRTYHPLTAAAVQPDYRGGVGDLTIDLSDVGLASLPQPITTRIDHGLGDVDVLVPTSADVQVVVDNGLGDVTLFGNEGQADGLFRGTGAAPWTGDDTPEIVLTVHAGAGDVEVSRG